jgi:4-amino-4-deoxy-L-arabinose transferase-like glycosyltransferase
MKLPKLSPLLFAVLSLSIIGIAAFLRLVNLDRLPSSLYWEEVALGYDAYSIAQTGRDHHGQSFPVVAFTSFGDYKPSGYFYAVVPFISLLGMNEWSVRLPSALAGISIVIGVGVLGSYLAKKIWKEDGKTPQQYAFLLGMLFSTFSPWLLQFSRGGWEVNLATAFLLWSVITALAAFERKVTRKKLLLLATATLLAALSMYVYHATRIIAPLLIAALFVMDWTAEQHLRQINVQLLKKRLLPLLLPGILFVLLISPLLLSSKSTTTQQRFAETSIASDGEYVRESNEFRDLAGNSLASKIFAHRYLFLAKHVSQAFFNHFTLDFLVISGDANPRHSTGFTGILLLPDSIWLCIGSLFFIILAYTRKELRPLLLFFLMVARDRHSAGIYYQSFSTRSTDLANCTSFHGGHFDRSVTGHDLASRKDFSTGMECRGVG